MISNNLFYDSFIELIFLLRKTFVYFFRNVRKFTAEVRARALSIGEPLMHREVTRSVAREVQALDAISLTYINAKLDGLLKSDITYVPLAAAYIVCHLDSDSAVIVFGAWGAPGAIDLLDVHSYSAVAADAVVRGRLALGLDENVSADLDREVACHVMNGDTVYFVFSGAREIRRETYVIHKTAVAHKKSPLNDNGREVRWDNYSTLAIWFQEHGRKNQK